MKSLLLLFLGVCLSLPMLQAQTTVSFAYTGAVETWTVPAGVTSINVVANGAQGGATVGVAGGGGVAAGGGRVTTTVAVTPGNVLNIFVGQSGSSSTGGYNGGGGGFNGGGGATDIR